MHVESTGTSVSEGPQSFGQEGYLLRLINVTRTVDTRMDDTFWSFESLQLNIVPCGQGKARFLKQEPRTWRARRENFGPLPLKYERIRLATSLSQ